MIIEHTHNMMLSKCCGLGAKLASVKSRIGRVQEVGIKSGAGWPRVLPFIGHKGYSANDLQPVSEARS